MSGTPAAPLAADSGLAHDYLELLKKSQNTRRRFRWNDHPH